MSHRRKNREKQRKFQVRQGTVNYLKRQKYANMAEEGISGKKEKQKSKGSYVQKGADRKEKQNISFGTRDDKQINSFVPYGATNDSNNTISSSKWYIEFSPLGGFYKAWSLKEDTLVSLAECYISEEKVSRMGVTYRVGGSETIYPFNPLSIKPPEELESKKDGISKELIEISGLVKQLNKSKKRRMDWDIGLDMI